MKNDLSAFEERLKKEFKDPPLPMSLEAGRVAEALKKRAAVIEVAPSPKWKRVLSAAAGIVLICAAAVITVLSLRQGSLGAGESADAESATSSYGAASEAAVSGAEAETGLAVAPEEAPELESAEEDALAYTAQTEAVISVASDNSGVPLPTGLDEKVSEAVLAANFSEHTSGAYAAEAHNIIGSADTGTMITVYAEAMYCTYNEGESVAAELLHSSYSLVAISFAHELEDYILTDYWQPSGEDLSSEIAGQFPEEIAQVALAASSEEELEAQCALQAGEYFAESA
ncbi:MAG: hypothetical protein Q4B42_04880 [Oscillospiraceae bacterium]|nr:hypothetical protein [Oscillospiraceae bacterium]